MRRRRKVRTRLHRPDQVHEWRWESQGDCGQLREHVSWHQSRGGTRGEIREPMSRASRLRLLRWIAATDWDATDKYLLCTFTYPDECWPREMTRCTQDRSQLMRSIETRAGTQLATLWRKEWAIRQSGRFKGDLVPHWHAIVFNCGWIGRGPLRDAWRTILRHDGPLCTDVRRAKTGEHAARYTAKYVAKYVHNTLDNGAYLNKAFGRPWGVTRPELVPQHAKRYVNAIPDHVVQQLRELVADLNPEVKAHGRHGFTLFNAQTAELTQLIAELVLDASGENG